MEPTLDAVRAAVATVAKVSIDEVGEATTFSADLGVDSLDLYDMVNILELQFTISVEDHELYELDSVGDLVALIDRLRVSA